MYQLYVPKQPCCVLQVKTDEQLETRKAVMVVERLLTQFSERQYLVTEYYEHWKVHVTTGKEFKTQWQQFIKDARQVYTLPTFLLVLTRFCFLRYFQNTGFYGTCN